MDSTDKVLVVKGHCDFTKHIFGNNSIICTIIIATFLQNVWSDKMMNI